MLASPVSPIVHMFMVQCFLSGFSGRPSTDDRRGPFQGVYRRSRDQQAFSSLGREGFRPLPGRDGAQNALRRGAHWRFVQTNPVASALSGVSRVLAVIAPPSRAVGAVERAPGSPGTGACRSFYEALLGAGSCESSGLVRCCEMHGQFGDGNNQVRKDRVKDPALAALLSHTCDGDPEKHEQIHRKGNVHLHRTTMA